MSKRLQEDWARVDKEGLRVLMNLRGCVAKLSLLKKASQGASSSSFLSKAILGGEAPSSLAYSLVDGASPILFSFAFRCISMLKDPASIEAPQASFHHPENPSRGASITLPRRFRGRFREGFPPFFIVLRRSSIFNR
ncbi:hypothetical protein GmHk_13G036235 [Glycine max]|nr:hypothetical protein GmHk_13G036235 [Glycine max]